MISIQDWKHGQSKQDSINPSVDTNDINRLLSHLFNKNTAWLYSHQETLLTAHQVNQLNQWIEALIAGKPLAYITGEKEFWTLHLKVNEFTLIPRPETELLIETIEHLKPSPKTILDLGTGSGAIALSLATIFPTAEIIATDQSAEALKVAKINAELNHISNVEFIQSDWFENLAPGYFDLIVSNPPYIDSADKHLCDLSHEPISALVAADNGLSDFKTISKNAIDFLGPGGILMFEHGWQQGEAVSTILQESGLIQVTTLKDLLGHDRISWGHFIT